MISGSRRRWLAFLCFTLVVSLTAGTPALAASERIVPSASPGSMWSASLAGVNARSKSDAWAVGYRTNSTGTVSKSLIRHWDGEAWTRVASPHPGLQSFLGGVSTISASDAWAVGSYQPNAGLSGRTLIEHWDGRAWTRVPSPNPSRRSSLSGVSAASASDAWAVGSYQPNAGLLSSRTLIEHWDGKAWTRVRSPNPSSDQQLGAVSAISAKNAWAVGDHLNKAGTAFYPRVEHWNGRCWTIVPSPKPRPNPNPGEGDGWTLGGVSAASAHDVWAVGVVNHESETAFLPLIEHWDGRAWTRVPSPNPGSADTQLDGVSAVSATDAWAVGHYDARQIVPLIEHWDGRRWSKVPSPSPDTPFGGSDLSGVSADAANDAWVVGNVDSAPPLVEHWDGTRWIRP
jgi:hypothetical protein